MLRLSLFWFACLLQQPCLAQSEILFADYFDIATDRPAGSEAVGKIHLKSNRDSRYSEHRQGYYFTIDKADNTLFEVTTDMDEQGRVTGVLRIAPGQTTGNAVADHPLRVSLRHGENIVASTDIVVHVVEQILWQKLWHHYQPETLSVGRMYGKKRFNDRQVLALIEDLEANQGHFSFTDIYHKQPSEFSDRELENAWAEVSAHLGGLGRAYGRSSRFGPDGEPRSRARLKRAIYRAVAEFMKAVPVDGGDLSIAGKPAGDEIGDGFSRLQEHGYASHGLVTHQWRMTDSLIAPLIQVWPELLQDMTAGDTQARQLYQQTLRYYQLFFAITPERRKMDDPDQRWRNLSDLNYSLGAWSDANIGHRMRTLLALPILWADYNRPMTYVPYWYDDYFANTRFQGLSFARNWSPRGVVRDLQSWLERMFPRTRMYDQSGFQPDGSITHHTGHSASDVAMAAYGFEWMMAGMDGIGYFRDTAFAVADENYQLIADRLDYSYRRLLYKGHLDFAVSGRSFFSDLSRFGNRDVSPAIHRLLRQKSRHTNIAGETGLKNLADRLASAEHHHSETVAFWNADYLQHRRENYFFSVKQKSLRTAPAEDFDKIKKSWHAGSGLFQLRIKGDEYDQTVLRHMDWHVLPGVTEEWRSDPFPEGPASGSLPGDNRFSGVLADGEYGLSAYIHRPRDDYTAARGLKSYHLAGRFGIALGSAIERKAGARVRGSIVTGVDQSALRSTLSYAAGTGVNRVRPGETVDLNLAISEPVWAHHGDKGYLIFPEPGQRLRIQTGKAINITASDLNIPVSENYLVALDHGKTPVNAGYHYVLVANADVAAMPELLAQYRRQHRVDRKPGWHAVYNSGQQWRQLAFFQPGKTDGPRAEWAVDKPALVMAVDLGAKIRLSVLDPLHDLDSRTLTLDLPYKLTAGNRNYSFPGIHPRAGETVRVISRGQGSRVVVALPDSRDGEYYDYREQVYAGAPITVTLDKTAIAGGQ